MPINKVKYGNNTLIDLTDTTATASEVLSGYSFHDKTGALVQGSKTIDLTTVTVTPTNATQVIAPGDEYYLNIENMAPTSTSWLGSNPGTFWNISWSTQLNAGEIYHVTLDFYRAGYARHYVYDDDITFNGFPFDIAARSTSSSYNAIIKFNTTQISNSLASDDDELTFNRLTVSVFKESTVIGYSQVTVNGDADLISSNIKKDVDIFGITGTYEGGKTYSATITSTGNSTGCYVKYPGSTGTLYYTANDTFEIEAGQQIRFYAEASRTNAVIYLNDVVVAGSGTSSVAAYDYVVPVCTDVSIKLTYGNPTTIYITEEQSKIDITINGTYNVSEYDIANVNVAGGGTTQAKTVSPTESQQTVTPDSGFDALSSVTVNAISSTYVGTGITRRSSTDLSASGATVTVPSGYYSSQATKSVSSGSASAPSTISGTTATVSTGTNKLTLTKTVSVTPTVTAGYVSSGTATNSNVSLTANVTTKGTATITPGTSNQTIAAGTYLTGTQTIAGDADLVAGNIKSGVQIFGVTGNLSFITYYTGSSAPSSSLGSDGDIYLKVA